MITGSLRVHMLDILQHIQPAASRHVDVEQQNAVLRYGQLGHDLITVGGFGKVCSRKGVCDNLSQAPAYVRVIICYQDIHLCLRPDVHDSGREEKLTPAKTVISVGFSGFAL